MFSTRVLAGRVTNWLIHTWLAVRRMVVGWEEPQMAEITQRPMIDIASLNAEHDPAATYRGVRERGAVARSEAYGGFWALVGYETVKRAAADAARLCSGQGATIPGFGNTIPAIPLEVDPPEHRDYRKLVVPALRPDRIREREDTVRAVTDSCIDSFIERGRADLAAELAQRVPPLIIARILGLPPEDTGKFVGWTAEMKRTSSSGDAAANKAAAAALLGYIDEKVTEAEGATGTGLIAALANAEIDGQPIGHLAAMGFTLTLVIAGHETTANGIASTLWLIGAHPETKSRLTSDPSLIPAAVEESLRLESPIQMMARTLTEDAVVEGVRMTAGDKLGLVWGAANLDETRFPRPEVFDIDRPASQHLAFGHGIHRCVGEHLARTEIRIAVEQILSRIPDYRIAGEVRVDASSVINRGPRAVPVAFTPGVPTGTV